MAEHWDELTVVALEDAFVQGEHLVGNQESLKLTLNKGGLSCDLDVELVVAEQDEEGKLVLVETKPLTRISANGSEEQYSLEHKATRAGRHLYSVRILPKHSELPHRQDFAYVRWVSLS